MLRYQAKRALRRVLFGRPKESLTCPTLRTPLIDPAEARGTDAVVVYAEVVPGNPLGARRVVRWCLHRPGYISRRIWFDVDELVVDHGTYLTHFRVQDMRIRDRPLHVAYSPNLALYLHTPPPSPPVTRAGSAYLVKKGRGKPLVHDLTDSVRIDDLTHEEILRVFDRVTTFYSYDPNSMYSIFAAARGAISIVIPDVGVSEQAWGPVEALRPGVGYGLEQADYSRATRHRAVEHLRRAEAEAEAEVRTFLQDMEAAFGPRR
jgi:hypothetical protein